MYPTPKQIESTLVHQPFSPISLLVVFVRNGNDSPMIEHSKAALSIREQEPHIPFKYFVIYSFGLITHTLNM
jgi:hypothetical protein